MPKKDLKRRAGVLVPLFSVYSEKSIGVGEFEDLKLLAEWCSKTGSSIIQLLPMNEVGSTFCPYDSVSSFALEPMYISLRLLRGAVEQSIKEKIDCISKASSVNTHVNYRIKSEKSKILYDIFLTEKDLDPRGELKKFSDENAYWLNDYSLFKALKDYHAGAPWYEWNEGYKNRNPYTIEQFAKKHKEELEFYKWTQLHAFSQFKSAKSYAGSKKILLKGDLPMLVSRDSADVWAHPEFFKLGYAAGAPPDMYCAKGQRWGMPTYNWDCIEAGRFIYIKEKLKFAENFYDILRIDHVVGLFRIWSIPCNEPLENKGLNGFFDPADEKIWGEHGRKLLLVLQNNTRMLLCAEDLGMIPKVCTQTLRDLAIPGNDVQRWTKGWETTHNFLEPSKYRNCSVAMLSTHDTTNWAAWWENEAGTVNEDLFIRKCNERGINYHAIKEKLFDLNRSRHDRLRWREGVNSVERFIELLGKRAEELKDFIELYENTYLEKEKLWKYSKLKGAMREKSDRDILRSALEITSMSNSVFCIELIFDLLNLGDICKGDPYKYRINKPGTVSTDNWSLRIPLSLEKLLKHKVNKDITKIITAGHRL